MAEITARELAAMLGISPSAVSLALNSKPGVSEKTRIEVMELAEKYNYSVPRASEIAAPAGKRSICLLIYVDQLVSIAENTSFSTFVLQGVESAASAMGYNTIIRYFTAETSLESFAFEMFKEVAGLIVLGTDITPYRLNEIHELLSHAAAIPVVVIDNFLLCEQVDCIGNDNFSGAKNAVRHLVKAGCRRIGYIRAKQRISNFDDREDGVCAALAQAKLKLYTVVNTGISSEQAYQDVSAWLQQSPVLPDAFFADNDVLAAAAIRALKNYGVDVPGQVSMIGFDDIPVCEMTDPPLSTVQSYKEQLGDTAVRIINDRLSLNQNLGGLQQSGYVKIQVSTFLRLRQSTKAQQ